MEVSGVSADKSPDFHGIHTNHLCNPFCSGLAPSRTVNLSEGCTSGVLFETSVLPKPETTARHQGPNGAVVSLGKLLPSGTTASSPPDRKDPECGTRFMRTTLSTRACTSGLDSNSATRWSTTRGWRKSLRLFRDHFAWHPGERALPVRQQHGWARYQQLERRRSAASPERSLSLRRSAD